MSAWNRFWFSLSRRHSLGVFRILLVAWLLLDFADFLPGLDAVASRPQSLFQPAAGLRWMGLGWIGPWVPALCVASLVLGLTSLVGAATRFSLLGLALTNWSLRAFHSSWSYVGHASIIPSIALFVLAVAPGSASWSLDALLGWWRDRRRGKPRPLLDAMSGPAAAVWPVHLLLALVAIVYFASGTAKIRDGGASWFSGRTLQWYLQGNAGQKRLGDSTQFFSARRDTPQDGRFRDPWGLERVVNSTLSTDLGRTVGSSRPLCAVLSWLTVALELGFCLVFWMPRPLQYAAMLAAVAFHAAIGAMMAIDFGGYALMFLATVDWNALAGSVWKWLPGVAGARRET